MANLTVTVDIGRSLGLSPQSSMINGYSGRARTLAEMDDVWNWTALHPFQMWLTLGLFFSDNRTRRDGYDAEGLAILSTPLGNGSSGRASGSAAWANFWLRWSRSYIAGRPSRTITDENGIRVRVYLRPGFAPIAAPGNSNHEKNTYQDHGMATDAVGWEDGGMGRNVARFGLLTFWNVGSEPWHIQLLGYGKSKADLQRDLAARGLPDITLPAIPLATPPPEPEPEPEPEKEPRIMYGIEMGLPITSPGDLIDTRVGGYVKPGPTGSEEFRTLKVWAVNRENPITLNAVAVDIGITAIQVEGNGYITCNGTTVLVLDGAATRPHINLAGIPVDEEGNIELEVYGTRCHVKVQRTHHRFGVQ